jgi:hypothetical protein
VSVRPVLVGALSLLLGTAGAVAAHQTPRRPGEGRALRSAVHLVDLERHRRGCDPDWDDCGGSGNYGRDQGGGNGNKGRDGDDQRGDKNCHSFCGNTIIVPGLPSSTTTTRK